LDNPVERHQLVFINPEITGLFAAWLAYRAGAGVAIMHETGIDPIHTDHPTCFPASGTFLPGDVELLAIDAGFPSPSWDRIPLLTIVHPDRNIGLNADDGPGGLRMSILEAFPRGRNALSEWLQEQFNAAEQLVNSKRDKGLRMLNRTETSIAESVLALKLPEPDPVILFFDTLSILVLGRGAVQIDIKDLPLVLAGIMNGWHTFKGNESEWKDILTKKLKSEGARWHDTDEVKSVRIFGRQNTVVRGADGTLFRAKILIVPEGTRYIFPGAPGTVNIIKMHNWFGKLSGKSRKPSLIGVIRKDIHRPPTNENFITFHIKPETGTFSLAAPVEERFLDGGEHKLENITARIKLLVNRNLKWAISSLEGSPQPGKPGSITLPGLSATLSYAEGPVWGDDMLTRLKAADRLSHRILERLS